MDPQPFILLLIGHSFIRRLRDFWIDPTGNTRNKDNWKRTPAKELAVKANLSQDCGGIYTFADYFNTIRDLGNVLQFLQNVDVRPDIACIHLGSNDLANLNAEDMMEAQHIARMVYKFAKILVGYYETPESKNRCSGVAGEEAGGSAKAKSEARHIRN